MCSTGHQLVLGQDGAGGWQQIGLFVWSAQNWAVPAGGSMGIYLRAFGACSQDGLTTRIRLVVAESLLEVDGTFLALGSGMGTHSVQSTPLILVEGQTYMIQAECSGSEEEEAFASVQAAIIIRQSF